MRSINALAIAATLTIGGILTVTLMLSPEKLAAATCESPMQDALMIPAIANVFTSSGSCDVVAAEFESATDVTALIRILPNCRMFIYSKSSSCAAIRRSVEPRSSFTCVELPNVGRETHTWIHHVLTHYADLADRVHFVPLPLFDSERMRSLKLILGQPARRTQMDLARTRGFVPRSSRPRAQGQLAAEGNARVAFRFSRPP